MRFAVDGTLREAQKNGMDEWAPSCRLAFRRLHGLPASGEVFPVLTEDARNALFAWARRHRMLGLLRAGMPGLDSAEWKAAAYGKAQHAARCMLEAERLFALLSPALPALALVKGPALAIQAWPDPGLRSFDDLDFLCARCDYPRLLHGMQAAGYRPDIADPRRMAHLWHYGWGIAFRHPDGFMVEVNHRFFPPHYPWPRGLDSRREDLFAPQKLETAVVHAPTPGLHLLLGCLHAVWHGWARMAWLADIAGLLARHPDALAQAETLAATCPFAQRALAAGCGVAEAIFGADLSPSPLPRVSAHVRDDALAHLGPNARSLHRHELRSFHEQFMTGREKAAYRLRRMFTPGDGDFRWVSLPPAWRGLYWALRPARGAWRWLQ